MLILAEVDTYILALFRPGVNWYDSQCNNSVHWRTASGKKKTEHSARQHLQRFSCTNYDTEEAVVDKKIKINLVSPYLIKRMT